MSTGPHEKEQHHGEQEDEQRQAPGRPHNEEGHGTGQQPAADASGTDPGGMDSKQASPEGGSSPTEPPAGTTSPSTLFGSEEMEGMKSAEQKEKEAKAGADEEERQKRRQAAEQSGSEKRYPAGTEFRYSGHTKVLEEEMTESQIFAWVADEFPEIEKGRFTLRYDREKGRLVPVPEAQKKGVGAAATTGSLQVRTAPPAGAAPPVYRLLCKDGVYEVRTNLSGTYVVRLEPEATLAENYYPAVPKAPVALLGEIVRIFGERPDTEALIDLVYDRAAGTFCLVWNQKEASAGSVEYQPLPDDERFVVYAEIHSHHQMPAFFSATDDESEKKTGVYGVLGRITEEIPEASFRYLCGGHFREIPAEDLFDDPSAVARTVKRPSRRYGGVL